MKIINPATEELIKEIADDSEKTIEKKFQLLRTAQEDWSRKPLTDRIKIIQQFSSLLEKNIESLAAILRSRSL